VATYIFGSASSVKALKLQPRWSPTKKLAWHLDKGALDHKKVCSIWYSTSSPKKTKYIIAYAAKGELHEFEKHKHLFY
jgi:hypothetical protein